MAAYLALYGPPEFSLGLMCLGAWSKMGLVKDKDLIEAGKLPDVDGDESELDSDWDDIQ